MIRFWLSVLVVDAITVAGIIAVFYWLYPKAGAFGG